MAKHILYNAVVTVNGTDLSDHVESVQYTVGINDQPAAAMSEVQDYGMPGTLTVSPVVINYFQDFAASETWATHKALWTGRSTFTLAVKADSAGDSATNPNFTGSFYISSMGIINGTRGERHMASVTYAPAGAITIDES